MSTRQFWLAVVLLWLSGAALRLTILAVPPVIPLLRADLHLSATGVGLLSGLPVALFALAAIPGSLLIARLGSRAALIGGLFVVAIGAALRGGDWGIGPLYLSTIIMGAGVAVMQPAMPVIARDWLPARIGFATAIYSNGLLVGEFLPVWTAEPVVLPLVGGNWRLELAIWAVPVLIIALLVLLLGPATPGRAAKIAGSSAWWPDWSDKLIWRIGILLGSVSAMYFATNAFLPAYLTSLGRGDLVHDALTALNVGQYPASLAMIPIAHRLERRAWPYLVAGIVMTVSVVGLVFMVGPWTIVWAGLLGCAGAATLILGFTLPPLLSEHRDVGRNSAAMFTLSYAIAMAVALICGAIWDATGVPAWAFAPILFCTLSLCVTAILLKANRQLR
ncbi:MAG TPA: MFS transporter [Stellaceae bacterium]